MKKVLMIAAALALLAAPALAQYRGGEQNAGAGSQMRQSAGGEQIATTGSTTKSKKRRVESAG
jgi:uncharacterized protein YdeI (BOF family)